MDTITITFLNPLQTSIQVGDTAYFTNNLFNQSAIGIDSVIEMGVITAISSNSITCQIPPTTERPTAQSFILFSKDNNPNISGLLGYFAEVELRNDSIDKAELFSVGSEIFESSK